MLTEEKRFMATQPLLEQAVALAPADPKVRLRRAVFFGRLGFYDKSKEDLAIARRYLKNSDVPALLYAQELDRWLREQSKSTFVRQSYLPRLPSFLSGLWRR